MSAAARRLTNQLKVGTTLTIEVQADHIRQLLASPAPQPQPAWDRRLRNKVQGQSGNVAVKREHLEQLLACQAQPVQQEFTQWIPHTGEDRPVPPDTMVLPMFWDGDWAEEPIEAKYWSWGKGGQPPIVAYCVCSTTPPLEQLQAAWVPHVGNDCPVDPTTKVKIKLREGGETQMFHPAKNIRWGQSGRNTDVAYWKPRYVSK